MSCASEQLGIPHQTVSDWLKRGRDDIASGVESVYATLADQVMQAEAHGSTILTGRIASAAQSDWKAAAWLLERRHEKWGRYAQEMKLKVETKTEIPPAQLIRALKEYHANESRQAVDVEGDIDE